MANVSVRVPSISPSRSGQHSERFEIVKDGNDIWIQDPFTIISAFRLRLCTMWAVAAPNHCITSDVCGLGWRFSFRRSSSHDRTLSLAFDPHLCPYNQPISATILVSSQGRQVDQYGNICPLTSTFPANAPQSLLPVWDPSPAFSQCSTVRMQIRLVFTRPFTLPIPTTPSSTAVNPHRAMTSAALDAITTGEMLDIKFLAYSKLQRDRRELSEPRELFATQSILRGWSSLLDDIMLERFQDFGTSLTSRRSLEDREDSDSDFEDAEDEAITSLPSQTPELLIGLQPAMPSRSPSFVEATTTDPGSPTLMSLPSSPGTSVLDDMDSGASEATSHAPRSVIWTVNLHKSAYKTWKCFLKYLYTNEITFSPLTSSGGRSSSADTCSPKSIYRLAHRFNITDLKVRARDAIRADISTQNVVVEVFSKFSAEHCEIQDMQLEFLLGHNLDQIEGLETFMTEALNGQPPVEHTRLIMRILRRWSENRTPQQPEPSVSVRPTGGTSQIASIRRNGRL